MREQNFDLAPIISRLELLEIENRRLKRAAVLVLVVAGAFFLMGQTGTQKTVEATQFNVKDSNGKIRGALGTFEGFTQLTLYGPEGAHSANPSIPDSVAVGNGPQGPYMTFTDAKGKTRVELSMQYGLMPGFWLFDGQAQEAASLVVNGDAARLHLGRAGGSEQFEATVDPDYGTSLHLSDKSGFQTAIGITDLETPHTGETHRTSAASITLFGKDKKVLWSAP